MPNSTTIGQATSSTFAGGVTASLAMSYGSFVIGTEYRERCDRAGYKIKEKEGMNLDTLCPPEQAYSKALSLIEQSVRTPDFLLKKQGGVPDYGVPM